MLEEPGGGFKRAHQRGRMVWDVFDDFTGESWPFCRNLAIGSSLQPETSVPVAGQGQTTRKWTAVRYAEDISEVEGLDGEPQTWQ